MYCERAHPGLRGRGACRSHRPILCPGYYLPPPRDDRSADCPWAGEELWASACLKFPAPSALLLAIGPSWVTSAGGWLMSIGEQGACRVAKRRMRDHKRMARLAPDRKSSRCCVSHIAFCGLIRIRASVQGTCRNMGRCPDTYVAESPHGTANFPCAERARPDWRPARHTQRGRSSTAKAPEATDPLWTLRPGSGSKPTPETSSLGHRLEIVCCAWRARTERFIAVNVNQMRTNVILVFVAGCC